MSADLEWGAPPPSGAGGRRHNEVLDFIAALKTRPGEWAKYPRTWKAAACGTYAKNHPGTEWVTRSRPDGRRDVWGRWIGGAS